MPSAIVPATPRSEIAGAERVRPTGHEVLVIADVYAVRSVSIGLLIVATAAAASVALLGVRADSIEAAVPSAAAGTASLVLCLLLAWRAPAVYWGLRCDPRFQALWVAWAAALLSVVPPLKSELWFISLGLLSVLGLGAGWKLAMTGCSAVLGANLTAHVVTGGLDDNPAEVIIGLWIGLPFWSIAVAVTAEKLRRHLLQIHHHHPQLETRPAAVDSAEDLDDQAGPGVDLAQGDLDSTTTAAEANSLTPSTGRRARTEADGLTARQLEVLLLVADGWKQTQIAARLGVSARAVQRLVAEARRRLQVSTTAELVAVAVERGITPAPTPAAELDCESAGGAANEPPEGPASSAR